MLLVCGFWQLASGCRDGSLFHAGLSLGLPAARSEKPAAKILKPEKQES
jgi:hypothetical protein